MTSLIDLRKPIIQFLGVDADPFLEEKKRCQDLLAALKYNFDPPPSSDTICENNRSVRELVKRLHAADYDEDYTDAPCSTRTNSSSSKPEMASQVGVFEIVNGRRYAVPAESEFHLGDAADCLGRMADVGREVRVVHTR